MHYNYDWICKPQKNKNKKSREDALNKVVKASNLFNSIKY